MFFLTIPTRKTASTSRGESGPIRGGLPKRLFLARAILGLIFLGCISSILGSLLADDPPTIAELRRQGRYSDAVPLARAALERREAEYGAAHWETREAQRILDSIVSYAALPLEARVDLARADTLESKVSRLLQRGRGEEAIAALEEIIALRVARLGEKATGVLTARLRLGHIIQLVRRDYAAAFPLIERSAHELAETLGISPYVATGWSYLGWWYKDLGEFRKAEPHYAESMRVVRALDGVGRPSARNHVNNYATFQRVVGDLEGAERTFRELYSLVRAGGADRANEAALIARNLAATLREMGDAAGAVTLLEDALAVREKVFVAGHPKLAIDRLELIEARLDLARREAGTPLNLPTIAGQLDEIIADFSAVDDPALAIALVSRGELVEAVPATDPTQDAASFFSRALAVATEAGDPVEIEVATRAARASLRGGKAERAKLEAERAIAALESLREDFFADPLDRARFAGRLRRLDPYAMLAKAHLALGDPVQAFETIERGRGRGLLELSALAIAAREEDVAPTPELQALKKRRSDAAARRYTLDRKIRSRQGRREFSKEDATELARLRRLRRVVVDEERALEGEWAERRAARAPSVSPWDVEAVLAHLEPGEILVAPQLWGDGRSMLFLLERGGEPNDVAVSPLGPGFAPLARELAAAETLSARAIDRLHQEVAPKDRARLAGARRILYLPVGPLERLPGEILLPRGTSVPVVWGPSATALLAGRTCGEVPDRSEPASFYVTVGDPSFGRHAAIDPAVAPAGVSAAESTAEEATSAPVAATTRVGLIGALEPLPGTRREARAIEALLNQRGRGVTLIGAEATEARLRAVCHAPRFLHLATHGLPRTGNAVLESSLALAESSTPSAADDGYLTLGEMLIDWSGKLEGTHLVVLSACETATGRAEVGEGTLALPWGFLFAGAEAVVATLWKVDDLATTLLMERLYENLLGIHSDTRSVGGRTFFADVALPRAAALAEAKEWLRSLPADAARARLGLDSKEWSEVTKRTRGIRKGRVAKGAAAATVTDGCPFADPAYWAAFILIGDGR